MPTSRRVRGRPRRRSTSGRCPRSSTWARTTWPTRSPSSGRPAPASRSSRSTTGSGDDQLAAQLDAHPGALVIHEGEPRPFADPDRWVPRQAFYDSLAGRDAPEPAEQDPDVTCLLLYTSGTTSAPKAAVLRHRHLVSYLFSAVRVRQRRRGRGRPGGRPAVPHRRRGQPALQPLRRPAHRLPRPLRSRALAATRCGEERVTQAMVIPTMLARIVDHLGGAADAGTPDPHLPLLRRLAHAAAGPAPGPRALRDDRLRQRLRPDRDQLDHRPARARGPPGRPRPPTTRRSGPAWARSAGCSRASSSRCATKPAPALRPGARPVLPPRRPDLRRVRRR